MEQAFVKLHGDLAHGQIPTEKYIKKAETSFLTIFFLLSQLSPHGQEKVKAGTIE